ncbi:unnamed protein product [Victoria cruziana]
MTDKSSSVEGTQTRQQKKATVSMEARMSAVEAAVATLNTSMEEASEGFVAYNMGTNQSFEQFTMQLGDLMARVMAMEEDRTAMMDEIKALKIQNRSLINQLSVLGEGGGVMGSAPLMKDLKPAKYGGARDVKELENFLYHIELYQTANSIVSDKMKITSAVMLLVDDAMLWWRRRSSDQERGLCHIDTWAEFKQEMRDFFLPKDTEYSARWKLLELKQTGSIHDYVKAYQAKMLEIMSMSDEDRLFHFMVGLQPWAEQELRRQDPKDLSSALAAAERLVDTSRRPKFDYKPFDAKENGNYNNNNGSHNRKKFGQQSQANGNSTVQNNGNNHGSGQVSNQNKPFRPYQGSKCWHCSGNHSAAKCPNVGDNQATSSQQSASAVQGEECSESPKIGALHIVSAMEGTAKVTTPNIGLMHLNILVNGRSTTAMVDTGATHNFVSVEEAKRLGLTLEKGELRIKAVNSEAKPICGVARDVAVKIENWSGKANFSVAPIDDYKMILGMDLMCMAKMVPMPHLRTIASLDEKAPYMIPAQSVKRDKGKSLVLSAIQLQKKGRPTFPCKHAKDLQEQMKKSNSHKAARQLKNGADQRRRPEEFQVGDRVLVELYPDRTGLSCGKCRASIRKFEGPFTVVRRIGKLAYKLDLPPGLKVRSVFHVRNLNPFYADDEGPGRCKPQQESAHQQVQRTTVGQMKRILRHSINRLGEPKKYLVKWMGVKKPTWEYAFRMKQRFPTEVTAYHSAASAKDGACFEGGSMFP